MSLTRKLLRELQLTDDAAERIIAAHVETVDAIRQERDALSAESAGHQEESARLRSEYDSYRRQVEQERLAQARADAIAQALRHAGANEQAIPLLAATLQTTDEDWEGAALRDAAATLFPVKTRYGAFFAQPVPIPTSRVSPPPEHRLRSHPRGCERHVRQGDQR